MKACMILVSVIYEYESVHYSLICPRIAHLLALVSVQYESVQDSLVCILIALFLALVSVVYESVHDSLLSTFLALLLANVHDCFYALVLHTCRQMCLIVFIFPTHVDQMLLRSVHHIE